MPPKSKTSSTVKSTTPKTTKPREFKLDVWRVLKNLDLRNLNFYDSLNDEEKKAFAPLVLMRWASAVQDNSGFSDYYISTVNSLVNVGFWELSKHPELQWKLLAVCGSGQTQRHGWIASKRKVTTSQLDKFILQFYPSLNDLELDLAKSKFTESSLKQFCRDSGMADNEIKTIITEHKKYIDGKATGKN